MLKSKHFSQNTTGTVQGFTNRNSQSSSRYDMIPKNTSCKIHVLNACLIDPRNHHNVGKYAIQTASNSFPCERRPSDRLQVPTRSPHGITSNPAAAYNQQSDGDGRGDSRPQRREMSQCRSTLSQKDSFICTPVEVLSRLANSTPRPSPQTGRKQAFLHSFPDGVPPTDNRGGRAGAAPGARAGGLT